MAYIEIKDIKKSFGRTEVVRGVCLMVEKGEIFGLLGPNGAGKSTTLGMLTGLLKPNDGVISIGGFSIREKPLVAKRLLGWAPQEIALYPKLSARDNLLFWGRMYQIPHLVLGKRITEVLEMVGLEQRSDEPIGQYSGGMKRRINIAAGLLHWPEVLILDEPTVGVDPQSRNHIFELIRHLNKAGTTVIYTSHYMEEVELLCRRVAIMDQGLIVAVGTTDELIKQAGESQEIEIQAMPIRTELLDALKKIPRVKQVLHQEDRISIFSDEAEQTLALAFPQFSAMSSRVSRIEIRKPNLETLFMKLTGRSLRD